MQIWLIDQRDETIAAARQSLDESGIVGIVSQGESNLGYGCIERVVEVDKRVFGPDFLAQLFPRDQLALVFQQDGADLKRLALQGHLCAILAQFPGLQVRFKNPETDNLRGTLNFYHLQPQACDSNSSTVLVRFSILDLCTCLSNPTIGTASRGRKVLWDGT